MEYFEIERDIEKFLNGEIVVKCLSKKDAREFLDFLISEYQIKWRDIDNIDKETYWNDNRCYYIKEYSKKLLIINDYDSQFKDKILIYQGIISNLNLNSNKNKKRKIIILDDFNLFT